MKMFLMPKLLSSLLTTHYTPTHRDRERYLHRQAKQKDTRQACIFPHFPFFFVDIKSAISTRHECGQVGWSGREWVAGAGAGLQVGQKPDGGRQTEVEKPQSRTRPATTTTVQTKVGKMSNGSRLGHIWPFSGHFHCVPGRNTSIRIRICISPCSCPYPQYPRLQCTAVCAI